MALRTAVIPAAGMGTRFLPATKAVPKELMPIFDTPVLQLVVDEAVAAGCEHVVVVSSRAKTAIDAYLAPSDDVVRRVRDSGRADLADRLARLGRDVRVTVVYQDSPRGLGHAVACARGAVGDGHFAVLLPDEIMGDATLLADLAAVAERTGGTTVALKEVPMAETSSYGVVTLGGGAGPHGERPVTGVVEKPAPGTAPSNLVIIGRYVLAPSMFDLLDRVEPAPNGEIYLTEALLAGARDGTVFGMVTDVDRFDTGTPMGWLQAAIELVARRPDVGPAFDEWLGARAPRRR